MQDEKSGLKEPLGEKVYYQKPDSTVKTGIDAVNAEAAKTAYEAANPKLESILQNISIESPFDRIRKGNSLPIVVISKPVFDQKWLRNEDSIEGAIRLIEALQKEKPNDDELPIFILGGAINDWRFNFTKKEGPRLSQTGYEGDWDFSQESYGDLKLRMNRLNQQMQKFPDNIIIYYTFSQKDDMNIEEMYQYGIHMFTLGVRKIYKTIMKEDGDINRLCAKLESMEKGYKLGVEGFEKKQERELKRREERSIETIANYKREKAAKEEALSDLKGALQSKNEKYNKFKNKLSSASTYLSNSAAKEIKEKWRGKVAKFREKLKTSEKDINDLEKKIGAVNLSIQGLDKSIQKEEASYSQSMEEIERNYLQSKEKANSLFLENLIGKLDSTHSYYLLKRDIIDKTSSDLATDFSVRNMAKFKDKFDMLAEKYDSLMEHIKQSKGRLYETGLKDLDLHAFTEAMESYRREFVGLKEDFEIIFSIRDREGMLTKREIPPALRDQVHKLMHQKYSEMLEEALSGDGKHQIRIRDQFSNNFTLFGKNGKNIRIRAGGYASKWDNNAAARSMGLNYIDRVVKGDFDIYQQLKSNPFPDQHNDPQKIIDRAYSKHKMDLVLIGAAEEFQIAQVAAFNSPHSTYVCSIGPFYDTSAAFRNEGKGARTQEQKEAVFFTSGLMLLDIDEFGIIGATPFSLEHLKRFDGFDYKTIPGYHDGDSHFGAGNQNKEAMHGLLEIMERDKHVDWYVHTGDAIDGHIIPQPRFMSQFESKLANISNQFGKFYNWYKDALDNILNNSELVTKEHFCPGQHDMNKLGICLQQVLVDIINAAYLDKGDRILYETNKRKEEKGHKTAFENLPVQYLAQSHEGVGIVKLRYKNKPENIFGEIFVSHNLGLDFKGSFMNPTSKSVRHSKQKRVASSNATTHLVGDKHLQAWGMKVTPDGAKYVSMNSGFISNSKSSENPYRVIDSYGWRYGSELRAGLTKLYIPFDQQHKPQTALLAPQSVLDRVYTLGRKKFLEDTYQQRVTLKQIISITT